ncbi:DUF1439 domain-containing protein [Herbaspirillum rhizosphaerae]|uniref:DUF1439 domain-containing protein n=1 Tax=Herbaspirillum rhizosphaerae TaxID=346179 RepID=UPI00067CCDDA|nr:DUF1439 domain-containing protein [Herbaspirillum rhizosphaerae]
MIMTTTRSPAKSWRHALAAAALACGALAAAGASRAAYNIWTSEYTFARADLQTAIATQFPRKLRYMEMFDVNLSNPRLSLNEKTNRLITTVDAQIDNKLLMNKPVTGTLAMSSALKYDPAARAVKLDAPAVEKVDIAGVPAQYAPQLNAIGNAAAEQVLKDYPIYTFKPEQLEMNGKRFEPGAITVLSDGVKVEIKPQ